MEQQYVYDYKHWLFTTTVNHIHFISPLLMSLNLQDCFQQLLSWSEHNDMAVNFQKTKEMVMGPPFLVSNFFTNLEFYW